MTSQHSSYCKNNNSCGRKKRIYTAGDHVDFIHQLAKYSKRSYIEYNNTTSRNDPSQKNPLAGTPTRFPERGKCSITFDVKSCNCHISTSSWYAHEHDNKARDDSYIDDYIDFEFEEAVYPIKIFIHDLYKGYVNEIWAQDFNGRWCSLWNRQYQDVHMTSRIFSPALQPCDFKTKMLRLNIIHDVIYVLTRGAVMLIGSSELILPRDPQQTLTSLLQSINHNLVISDLIPNYAEAYLDILKLQKKFSEYCIIYKSGRAKSYHNNKLGIKEVSQEKDVSPCERKYINHHTFSSDESKEQPRCSFSAFPDEIILKILKMLDSKSLCRTSRVNKRLNNLTLDPFLFTCLNIRNMHLSSVRVDSIMSYFVSRCKYLKQLDLTSSDIPVSHFVNFLNICGSSITHLRLTSCKFVNDVTLLKISEICKNLKVLDLSHCNHSRMDKFLCLKNPEFLENLNLGWTSITNRSICKILQKYRRIRKLNLNVSEDIFRPFKWLDLAVATQLKNSCPNLEMLSIIGRLFTHQALNTLLDCKNLRIVYLGCDNDWEYLIDKNHVHKWSFYSDRIEKVEEFVESQ